MYSPAWYDTFAAAVPAATTAAEVAGIVVNAPPDRFPRLLEIGCGTGRVAGPLSHRGYRVVGIDVSRDALRTARRTAPGPAYVALDQAHVVRMRWTFDVVAVVWNSLGFAGREGDRQLLRDLRHVLGDGGRLLLDLYHPAWLLAHQQVAAPAPRGATVSRWLRHGRLVHRITYPDGGVDEIAFEVYPPEEMRQLVTDTGFTVSRPMAWWDPDRAAGADVARYQLVCTMP